METFDIEQAFQDYLAMVKLDITKMSSIQIEETKRAFYGGCGYMLRALVRVNQLETQHKSLSVFNQLEKQIGDFFLNEIKL